MSSWVTSTLCYNGDDGRHICTYAHQRWRLHCGKTQWLKVMTMWTWCGTCAIYHVIEVVVHHVATLASTALR